MAKVRITCDVDKALAKTIVELVLDRVSNLSMVELPDDRPPEPKQTHPKSTQWLDKFKEPLLTVLRRNPEKGYRYDDPAIAKVIKELGYNPASASPVLSELEKAGLVRRVSRGVYMNGGL